MLMQLNLLDILHVLSNGGSGGELETSNVINNVDNVVNGTDNVVASIYV